MLDEGEGRELHDALMSRTGGGGADGEEPTAASVRLDEKPRTVHVSGNAFPITHEAQVGAAVFLGVLTAGPLR